MPVTVDTTGFKAMVADLSRMSGTPIKNVLLYETGRILENCIENTRTTRASVQELRISVEFQNRSVWESGNPRKPKERTNQIGYITKGGSGWFAEEPTPGYEGKARGPKFMGSKTFHDMSAFRWSSPRWARWQTLLERMRANKIDVNAVVKSRGLAKNSWWQIAKALGISGQVKAPAYVKNARPSNNKLYTNGRGKMVTNPEQIYVEISNNSPGVVRTQDGASILSRAIQGRLNYFKNNMALAVFHDIKSRARAYKGIFVE